jgi:hypothetical protein
MANEDSESNKTKNLIFESNVERCFEKLIWF